MDRRSTTQGTPCSPRWSADWIAQLDDAEARLGLRICGGVGYDGAPCAIPSNHPSGRCRYHGGTQNIGGGFDNANARIHGLYARRIQRCGPECVLWNSCPMAGDDVANLPLTKRPWCVYEREEYLELLRFYFKATTDNEDDDDEDWNDEDQAGDAPEPSLLNEDVRLEFPKLDEVPEPFLLHQMIVLQVMVSRAAAVLGHGPLTDTVDVHSPNYRMKTAKPAAALEAFIRLSREYRGLRGVIDAKKLLPPPQRMGIGSRMRPLMKKAHGAIEAAIAETERRRRAQQAEEARERSESASADDEKRLLSDSSNSELGMPIHNAAQSQES